MPGHVPRPVRAALALLAASSLVAVTGASAAGPADRYQVSAGAAGKLESLRLPEALDVVAGPSGVHKLDPALLREQGIVEVLIRLKGEPAALAELRSPGSGPAAKARILADQAAFISGARLAGRSTSAGQPIKVTARTQVAINAVFAEVDAARLREIARMPEVERVSLVRHYEMQLAETVPQIGAAAVQAGGLDGAGIKVAVLDSGIDYTHAAFGGPGTPEAYTAAYGDVIDAVNTPANTSRDGLFPTPKVVEGFDFVGEEWPSGARTEDDDPIAATDINNFGGHGTHVADIIGGITPGVPGVAPGVDLYAVKVCAAYSSSCNGVALIKGVEYSLDPNGDGDISDRVDIMNMSLGANFGQAFDDDLAFATDVASAAGVLTVAAAGNGSNVPFITGTPAAAPTAVSVAQTAVASQVNSLAMQVLDPVEAAGLYEAAFQAWSAPLADTVEGPVTYAETDNLTGCLPFATDLTGQIVMVDRGGCTFTLKIANIQDAGGVLGIIGLVAPGAPFAGGDGGDLPASGTFDIPAFMIDQAAADILRSGAAAVRFEPGVFATDYPAKIVSSSSRGPAYADSALKPEISAPGASVSAASATGEGVRAFGGTSGATPMVAGAAALLMQAYPGRRPHEIKALLMNTAETGVHNDVTGALEPISRIGAGEVRVDRALASSVAAWDLSTRLGGLSFGYADVAGSQRVFRREILLRNYGTGDVTFEPTPTFRNQDDAATGAVVVQVRPSQVTVPAGGASKVYLRMTIDGSLLPANAMSDGADGGNPDLLTFNEFDGYLLFNPVEPTPAAEPIAMPWHVLPRRSAAVEAERRRLEFVNGADTIGLLNRGVGAAQNDAYSLLFRSRERPQGGGPGEQFPNPALRAMGVQTYVVDDGFCAAPDGAPDYVMAFAFHFWERQALSVFPGQAGIALDVDGDGGFDYDVYNIPLAFAGSPGDYRSVTLVYDIQADSSSAFFFTEHATNTANQVLYVCDSQIGSPPLLAQVASVAYVGDAYFGSSFDAHEVSWAPLGERFFAVELPDLAPGAAGAMQVVDLATRFGPAGLNPREIGLLVFTNGDRGPGARGGATQKTEALIFLKSFE